MAEPSPTQLTKISKTMLLIFTFLMAIACAQNPGDDLAACINDNGALDQCLQQSVANMGDKYKRGVPELGLPSLDPMSMPKIEIQMGSNKVKMEDITSSGMSNINVTSVSYDKSTRLMTMRMIFRDTVMNGKYTVEVLGKSSGPYKSRLRNMVVKSVAELAKKEDGVEVKDLQMKIDIGNIKVQMECLFPNEETCADPETHPAETYSQDCCCEKNIGRGEVKSCNPLLAKTTHKAMNRQGDNSMMARFSPQITGTVGDIVKDYLNVAFGHMDPDIFSL